MAEDIVTNNAYNKRPMWQWILLYLIVAIVVYGAVYFLFLKKNYSNNSYTNNNGQNSSYSQSSPTSVPTKESTGSANSTKSQEKTFTVSGSEFSFTPSVISVNKGDSVSITFKNTGKYPHNLTISTLNINTKTIQPGQEDTISFVVDKIGTFEFTCTVPGHADRGMVGKLTVQ